jgi:hypothetical protein
MPPQQEDRKFYIRAPSLEYQWGGPIRLGHVIKDAFNPQDPITTLDPMPKVITGNVFAENRVERETYGSLNLRLAAKIYEAFGAQAEARHDAGKKTVYEFDLVEPWYFETNPTPKYVKALVEKDADIKAAVKKGPVYIVTGINVAVGLKYTNQSQIETKVAGGASAHMSAVAELEAKAEGSKGHANQTEHKVLGNSILAYRLHVIQKVGWPWKLEYEVSSFNPGEAGFMNAEEKVSEDMQVETRDLSKEDLDGFIEENEYDESVREIDFWDGDGEAILICVDK